MLNGMKQTFIGYSEVCADGEFIKIAEFVASLNLETHEITFGTRYLNKDLCKEHRNVVRADHADFEDFVYRVQEKPE